MQRFKRRLFIVFMGAVLCAGSWNALAQDANPTEIDTDMQIQDPQATLDDQQQELQLAIQKTMGIEKQANLMDFLVTKLSLTEFLCMDQRPEPTDWGVIQKHMGNAIRLLEENTIDIQSILSNDSILSKFSLSNRSLISVPWAENVTLETITTERADTIWRERSNYVSAQARNALIIQRGFESLSADFRSRYSNALTSVVDAISLCEIVNAITLADRMVLFEQTRASATTINRIEQTSSKILKEIAE